MGFRSKFDINNICHIGQVVREYDIQIINAQSSKDRYTSIFAKWLFGFNAKVIHTRRQVSKSVGGLQSLFYTQGTDKVIAVSNGIKESLVKKGIPEAHIKVIYNGTPRDKYESVNPGVAHLLKKKFDIKENDFVIGCIAREKEQPQLLKALKYLPFKTKVIFVGIVKLAEHDKIVANYAIHHEIFYEGKITIEKTLQYYPLFNVKVLPSTMEGLSQSILEAMYLKIPVIATAAAGNLDLVKHNENGFLFDIEDINGLKQIITDIFYHKVNIPAIKEKAYLTASESFSIGKTIDNYENFFAEMLNTELTSSTVVQFD